MRGVAWPGVDGHATHMHPRSRPAGNRGRAQGAVSASRPMPISCPRPLPLPPGPRAAARAGAWRGDPGGIGTPRQALDGPGSPGRAWGTSATAHNAPAGGPPPRSRPPAATHCIRPSCLGPAMRRIAPVRPPAGRAPHAVPSQRSATRQTCRDAACCPPPAPIPPPARAPAQTG